MVYWMLITTIGRLRYNVVSLTERVRRPHRLCRAYRSLTMLSRAARLKEGKHGTADMSPQEESHDESDGNQRPAATRLFSSPASTLFFIQLEQLTSQPGLQPDAPAPIWARRLCGRWLLAQRLRLGVTTEVIVEQVRVGA